MVDCIKAVLMSRRMRIYGLLALEERSRSSVTLKGAVSVLL